MVEQGTPEWHQERLGKVTASRIADVMMKPTTAGYQNYQAQLVCERLTGQPTETFVNAAMQHGTETEPQARAMYELAMVTDVQEVGFINHPSISMSGASPDGLVGKEALVEIKCPQPATHIKTLTSGKIDRKYILQMQWQLICTGRRVCDFVSFCPSLPSEMQLFVQHVHRDPEMEDEISKAVQSFLTAVDETVAKLTQEYKPEAA